MAYTIDDLLSALDSNDLRLANTIAAELGLEPFRVEPLYPCMRDNTCMPIVRLLADFGLL